jgi:hypothetical protein
MAVNSVLAAQTGVTGSGGGGSGTVTSVALSAPAQFSVTGSPVTTSGTLALAWASQTANTVLAGPTSGGSAAPTFRALVAADIPSLSGSYINNSTSAQASANFNIGANGVIGGTLGVTGTSTLGVVNASGLVTGTAGLTITGAAVNLNASSNFAVNIGTGTTTSTVTIGNSANALTVSAPATFGATGTGLAVTNNATVGGTLGVTGAVTGGTYNSQTISSAASFTGSVAIATTLSVTGASTQAAITASGIITFSQNGAASASAVNISGSAFTGGTATTTFPLVYISPTGTAGATTWSTNGTYLGFNAVSGFTGNFIDCHVAGGASLFSVDRNGRIACNNGINVQGSGGIALGGTNAITVNTTGGLTATGSAWSVNASSNFNVSLCTGTSTGTVAIGGGSGSVSVSSTTWNVTTAGAASGLTTIAASGTIYSSGGTIGSPTFALTDAASISLDLSKGNSYSVTLGGNRTLANPTNATAGTAFRVSFKQDGTGSRTMSFGANYDTAGFTQLTGTANKIQEVYFFVVSSSVIRVLATNAAEFTN